MLSINLSYDLMSHGALDLNGQDCHPGCELWKMLIVKLEFQQIKGKPRDDVMKLPVLLPGKLSFFTSTVHKWGESQNFLGSAGRGIVYKFSVLKRYKCNTKTHTPTLSLSLYLN